MYHKQIAEELAELVRTEHADNGAIKVSRVVVGQWSDSEKAQFITTDDDDTAGLYLVTVERVTDSAYYRSTFPLDQP